jgi:glycosyltransferase involved in cell wall biosynthesis
MFRELAGMEDIDLTVLFAMLPDAKQQGEGFGTGFSWDIPLLEGYNYRVLDNVARAPGVTRFGGCDTPDIKRVLCELRPAVVVVNGWVVKTCLQALWACKGLSIPCLVRGEANDLRPRPVWKKLGQAFLLRQFAGCLFIGKFNREFYVQRRVPAKLLFHSPYGIDNQRFERQAMALLPRREQLRAQWQVPEGAVCYLFCAKFEVKKQPLLLLSAFRSAVADARPGSMHLLMVGDGALRAECESYARRYSLPVNFAGFMNQSRLAEAYVAADCLVLPSDSGETWGLVVNEAMACGRPAIVSDHVGCQADLVEAGVTGEVFPVGKESELAERLCRLAADPGLLSLMGKAARQRVAAYTPLAAAEGIREAVLKLR